tara:strand:- start:80 stop:466 length:387 start_codon:yes stop_codon:yes gene_type:complete
MEKSFFHNHASKLYVIFRILIGLMFLLHGIGKIQGILAGSLAVFSLMGLAALIETLAGLLMLIGLVVRPAALISALEILIAYLMVHASKGLNPLTNGGELALLYFAAFLVLLGYGAGQFSLDRFLSRK